MINPFSYCPRCASNTFRQVDSKKWVCGQCHLQFYCSPSTAVAALILDDSGRLLLTRRAKAPGLGLFGLPGGFVDPGESAEEGLKREVLEEVFMELVSHQYLISFANVYHYADVTYHTVDLFFVCRARVLQESFEKEEIASVHWMRPEAIDLSSIAFPSVRKAIEVHLQTAGSSPL